MDRPTPAQPPAEPQRPAEPQPPARPRPRRARRSLLVTAGVATLTVVLLAAVLSWLGSESLLREVAARAVAAAGGRLTIDAPQGSLFGTVRIARAAWRDAGVEVEVTDATVSVDWRTLPAMRVRVRELTAARVEVVTPRSDAPAELPASLAPPIGVELVKARIGELVLREAGADVATRLTDLQVSARHARAAWTVDALSLAAPFGTLSAGGTVGDAPPFAVSARALLQTRVLDEPVAVDATATGTLAALAVEARTVLRDASASARASLAPFASQPLTAVELSVTNADLSRFVPGMPSTRLEGRLQGRAPAAAARGQPGGSAPRGATGPAPAAPPGVLPPLEGTLSLRNARPGSIDAGLLPISAAQAGFAFDGERLQLRAVSVDGPAGRLTGDASVRLPAAGTTAALPAFELRLATDALDLQRIHGVLRATALRGDVRVAPDRGGLAFEGSLADGELALDARARLADALLTVERAQLRARDGIAEFSGSAAIASPYAFQASGTVSRLDPSRFADVPPGLLAGSWQASGQAGPRPSASVAARLVDSRWRGLPLAGSVAATWAPGRVSQVDTTLELGATRLTARGDLGTPGDRLAIAIDARRLQELDARLAGRAVLEARLADALNLPRISASLRGQDLRVGPRIAARQLRATAEVERPQALRDLLVRLGVREELLPAMPAGAASAGGTAPPLAASVRLEGVRIDATAVDAVGAELAGDADRHRLTAGARSPALGVDATLGLEGGLERGPTPLWRGRLVEAGNTVAPRLRLLEPAPLAVGAQAVSGGPLQVEIDGSDGARLRVESLGWQAGRIRLQGQLAGVPLRWLDRFVEGRGLRTGDADALRIGARFDVDGIPGAGGDLRGRIEAFRESGDVAVDVPRVDGGTEVLRAGLSELVARVELAEGQWVAGAALRGESIGTLRADARAPLAWADGVPDLRVPLTGRVELSMPSLAFTRAVVGESWRFEGALQARVTLGGTLAAPRGSGRIEGTGLVAEQRELGMRLVDGTLSATLRDDELDVESLRFASGKGSVSLTGALRADERSEAVLTLDRTPIPLGAGQRLLLSGEARATLRSGRLTLRGALRADEGVIELTANNAPKLSSDVVVVRDAAAAAHVRAQFPRRGALAPAAGAASEAETDASRGFRVVSDLQIDLGDRLRVFGAGVEARLEGRLALRGRLPEAPRLTGTVRVVQGTYTGFGQQLEIERGTLVFTGPVDNPAIDVVAYRRYLPVEAGVAVTGTARVPRVALVSRPDVPDPDKLSWLVLGTGADTARSGGQNSALQAAAATLLATADPNAAGPGFASTFGLDVLSIRTAQAGSTGDSGSAASSAQDSIVTLGKRLTDRLFVSYEQSLRGLQNLLRLQYEISERLSVRARVGTQNALDLLWQYRYE